MFQGVFVVPDSIIPITCKFSIMSTGLGHLGSSAHVLREPTHLTGAASAVGTKTIACQTARV